MNINELTTTRAWTTHANTPAGIMLRTKPLTPPAPAVIVEDIDSACLRALAAGDSMSFASLVQRWQTRLINFFYRSTQNRADAEDLAQETFLELYRAASRYTARGTFSAFIFTLARRRLIDSYRKSSRRPLDFIDPTDFVMQQQFEQADAIGEIEEAFHLALAALPENQRNAILLLQQQGLAYDEIAEALNTNLSSVKTWIHRARTHLRKELKDFT
ncbi:MAG: sigma-70 family RNA polymerase sigma factor [Opitutae bacterium]|nr:sigma-70 family RNA polymerase sigma factor [Opitutae bacterium]MDG1301601.1 sigma-70 family RNA polymerase sigma factor [Opitutae bacterium]